MCDYDALGHHRSGTDRDGVTTEWFVDLMSDLGEVTISAVEFKRYDVVRLRLRAGLVPGRTANIEVGNGQPGRRLVLTTPLNGWFGAAGERGAGITVLRHVAERLADRPLTVVATGGHELGCLGAYAWVDRCTEPPASRR